MALLTMSERELSRLKIIEARRLSVLQGAELADISRRQMTRLVRLFRMNGAAEKLLQLEEESLANKMVFGFAENDFLHLNTFQSCCNGADLFLRDAHYFEANILCAVKAGIRAKQIRFSDINFKPYPFCSGEINML